jgi:hypothetical protein
MWHYENSVGVTIFECWTRLANNINTYIICSNWNQHQTTTCIQWGWMGSSYSATVNVCGGECKLTLRHTESIGEWCHTSSKTHVQSKYGGHPTHSLDLKQEQFCHLTRCSPKGNDNIHLFFCLWVGLAKLSVQAERSVCKLLEDSSTRRTTLGRNIECGWFSNRESNEPCARLGPHDW